MARTTRVTVAPGAAALTLALAALLGGCSGDDNEPQRDASGNVTETADGADVFAIQVGDCLGDFGDSESVSQVSVGPCDQEHAQEVFATAQVPDGDFPTDEVFETQAGEDCVAEFETFVGVPYADSELDFTWLQPTEESWGDGDRELVCLVYDPAGPVTGTLEGAGR